MEEEEVAVAEPAPEPVAVPAPAAPIANLWLKDLTSFNELWMEGIERTRDLPAAADGSGWDSSSEPKTVADMEALAVKLSAQRPAPNEHKKAETGIEATTTLPAAHPCPGKSL
jgi:hypothetical protein